MKSKHRPISSISRRDFLWHYGGGLGGLALAHLMGCDLKTIPTGLSQKPVMPHHLPKAKRVIQLFMSGAASQVDTFDYKPELIKRAGQQFDPGGKVELFQSAPGVVMPSPWEWKQYGQSGKWVSSLVPHLARCVDDIAFLPAMTATSNIHGPATFMQNTGFVLPGFPSVGSWVSYGLGKMTDNLPTFVVLPDSRGYGPGGQKNWDAGFLPSSHQGTLVRPALENPIADLFPPEDKYLTPQADKDGMQVLKELNQSHLKGREYDSRLEGRIQSYELAAKLQVAAPEVFGMEGESDGIKKLYGLDDPITEDFGRNCLIARRLLERGTRFVQIWSGADNAHPRRNWDSHEDLKKDHGEMAASMDKPAAALLIDLKQRGMLEDTIVYWTTEFGRMPCSQGSAGRDHNPFTFTSWVAGGGIKGGVTYGASDEWSYKAVENTTYCYDLHATILHLLGINHERLTVQNNGIDRRLTDVHGHVIKDILV
ncbi:MAG: DUF1501 domain-containing protein [Bacteroidetes bacterium]|nr:DUF1501 domain-containing protein [Bacteroidota bacterium]MDA1122370.1 DUF1501 domain-containing protein [Bacteroidota bacterium]